MINTLEQIYTHVKWKFNKKIYIFLFHFILFVIFNVLKYIKLIKNKIQKIYTYSVDFKVIFKNKLKSLCVYFLINTFYLQYIKNEAINNKNRKIYSKDLSI